MDSEAHPRIPLLVCSPPHSRLTQLGYFPEYPASYANCNTGTPGLDLAPGFVYSGKTTMRTRGVRHAVYYSQDREASAAASRSCRNKAVADQVQVEFFMSTRRRRGYLTGGAVAFSDRWEQDEPLGYRST